MADVANNIASPMRRDGIGDMEVTVNTKQIRKLAMVGAAAALSLQLVAGTASAAVPNASATGQALGTFGGNGYAGFTQTFAYADSSTLSKLYLESDITGGASVVSLAVTKNGQSAANACSVQASPLAVKCQFKTIRNGDVIKLTFAVSPLANAASVSTEGFWSSTGFVLGGNNSHGDAWSTTKLTAVRNASANFAGGFGNTSLDTSTTNLGGNGQAASLKNLPSGKYAFVNDNAATVSDSNFPIIEISVNGGAAASFQLVIVYPHGTNAPASFVHTSDGYATTTYTRCSGSTRVNCFTWSQNSNTATLYLQHNGTLKRAG